MAREPSEVMRLPAAATGRAAALPVLREPPTPATKTAERRSDVDAWGRSERARRFARTAFDPVYRHWFRAEWDGLDRIPTSGGALLVANHAGAVPPDAPVIMHGIESEIGRPVYGLADHLFKDTPVVGTIWNRMGGVVAHPDNAYRLLHDDEALVLVFPEGGKGPAKTIRDRYRLARFGRGGFIEIAMRAGVPIIPIAVIGAEEAMPTLVNLPWVARRLGLPYLPLTANAIAFGPAGMLTYFPAKFRLRVLEPVTFDVPPNLERYSRSRVMEASEDVRTRIQQAVFDMLRARKSVWR
ncbi:MAG TPA: lysophospholipid acyltransferase family protein [Acidimicrobiales bacterium]